LSEIDERELEKLEQANRRGIKFHWKSRARGLEEEKREEDTNYYKENIFNKEDYYLYRAVMYFYAGDYDKSIGDFE